MWSLVRRHPPEPRGRRNIYHELKLLQQTRHRIGRYAASITRCGATPFYATHYSYTEKSLAGKSWHGACLVFPVRADSGLLARRTIVKIIYLFMLLMVAIAASACNTTRGVGQDIEATGEAIERTAEDAMDDDD